MVIDSLPDTSNPPQLKTALSLMHNNKVQCNWNTEKPLGWNYIVMKAPFASIKAIVTPMVVRVVKSPTFSETKVGTGKISGMSPTPLTDLVDTPIASSSTFFFILSHLSLNILMLFTSPVLHLSHVYFLNELLSPI